jgi:hypothetical protein
LIVEDSELIATIDQIEQDQEGNKLAVLVFDDSQQLIIPLDRLPDGCQEGTVLKLNVHRDQNETDLRREHIRELQSRLFGSRSDRSGNNTRENQ